MLSTVGSTYGYRQGLYSPNSYDRIECKYQKQNVRSEADGRVMYAAMECNLEMLSSQEIMGHLICLSPISHANDGVDSTKWAALDERTFRKRVSRVRLELYDG